MTFAKITRMIAILMTVALLFSALLMLGSLSAMALDDLGASLSGTVTTDMTLDLDIAESQATVTLAQGSADRRFSVALTEWGDEFDMPTLWSAVLYGTAANGTAIRETAENRDGLLLFSFDGEEGLTAAAGTFPLFVDFFDIYGEPVCTITFDLTVALGAKDSVEITKTLSTYVEPDPYAIATLDSAPAYIVNSADQLIRKVKALQNENTVTFIATGDYHWYSGLYSFLPELSFAQEHIRDNLELDFAADMGDVVWGASNWPDEDTVSEMKMVNSYVVPLWQDSVWLRTAGNHDPWNTSVADRYEYISSFNQSTANAEAGVVVGDEEHGYCYYDLPDRKTRFIMINTAEQETVTAGVVSGITMSDTQRLWVCEVLADMKSSDKADWSIVLSSHHPFDMGGDEKASETMLDIITAYDKGTSITVAGKSFNYAGDRAPIVAHFHGHLHNFTVFTYVGTSIPRICIPHASRSRTNEYGRSSSRTDSFKYRFGDLNEYGEAITPFRVYEGAHAFNDGNRQDDITAFNVVVLDTETMTAHCINFGAGYDRSVSLERDTGAIYSVSYSLSGVTARNNRTVWGPQYAYKNTLTTSANYMTVTVTMGGVDVTDRVYKNGEICIENMSGNVVITAKAADTFNVSYALSSGISSSNTASTTAAGGSYTTTLSPAEGYAIRKVTVYMGGVDVTSRVYANGAVTIPTVTEDISIIADTVKLHNVTYDLTNVSADTAVDSIRNGTAFTATLTSQEGYLLTSVKVTMGGTDVTDTVYANGVISIDAVTGDLSITATAEKLHGITLDLTNVSADTAPGTIPGGTAFTATLTPADGYLLTSVKVTMGGTDVTDTVYADGVISIDAVTGDLSITATAVRLYSVTYDLSNVLSDTFMTTVLEGASFSAILTPADGYTVTSVKIMMNGTDVTDSVLENGKVSIDAVTGDVIITAEAILLHNVTYVLDTGITADTSVAVIEDGQTLTVILTPAEDYALQNVTVTVNGVDVTASVYADGTVTVPAVTGDVVITATAKEIVRVKGLSSARFQNTYAYEGTSARLAVTTIRSANVKDIVVLDENGNVVEYVKLTEVAYNRRKPTQRIFYVDILAREIGKHTYTVYGVDAEGNLTSDSINCSIQVR